MYNDEKILLVDDEAGLLHLLKITLEKERYHNITCAMTGAQALEIIKQNTYDLILLDVMLPDFSGFDLCSEIRKYTFAPIIFLTACGSDFDKLTGLALGGDDYITKPFNPLEVMARIKAILRRQKHYTTTQTIESNQPQLFDFGIFQLNPATATLVVNNQEVECTAKEFDLLCFFCNNPNHVFTTTQIYEAVWDTLGLGDDKTVTMHISKLRKKLGDDPKTPKLLITLRGIGYKFNPPKKEHLI
ncbi:DNA-binding response regulator [Anaerocolumna cellulosilytica]|uniref:Stage 0 sporulation protein A homolog n=1 Tax=Anaerocolumna cellulosilytica TaxID=433286 RepID=A0A6S6RA71_9FIRM|nr:response regulator transcription factor [Anaerocolumna cellulosilytica]MBB5196351.1 DNA-binding response OmpR family regulator [Anaerocolumna cellulosilytica]BCJ96380.1 DNA-binding response regulator [Anaerocolumna cellulosilytica]